MKNCRTPRTLAECEFHTGYPIAHVSEPRALTVGRAVVCVLACIAIGLMVGVSL